MVDKSILIEVRNLTKSYGEPGTERHQVVLDNLSFDIGKGESIAITGPSGSGKTTLLNMLGTLDLPDKGEVHFDGRDISHLKTKDLEAFRNRSLGFVFQHHHLLPQFNLMENVLVPTLPARDKSQDRKRAEELIQKVGLWEHRHKYPHELSGGECQRTAVIRSLINNPDLVLADEPTGSLDFENSIQLMELLLNFNREDGVTLVVVTHSRELALKLDRTYNLHSGNLEMISES